MGCDIHMAVERRIGDRWERVLPPESARDPWLVSQAAKAGDDGWMAKWYPKRAEVTWYGGRNYTLFGVLAGVRDSNVVPIAEPRGLPDDMSPDVVALIEDYDSDDIDLGDHSQTWLLLSEILAYDWDQPYTADGVVGLREFAERVKNHGEAIPLKFDGGWAPYDGYCGGTFGPGIYTLEAPDAVRKLRAGGIVESPASRPHVRDYWTTPLRAQIGDFLTRTVPALQALDPDPSNVRLVFGFDS